MLLHENFADITHVAVVDPSFAPPVLTAGPVPLLEVEVTETGGLVRARATRRRRWPRGTPR